MNSPYSTFVRRHANAASPKQKFEAHRIHLHGFIEHDYTSALDFYRPIVQSYPPPSLKQPSNGAGLSYLRTAPLIEHLDVCTVLKDLSLADAEIMLSIDKVFRTSLEDLLASQLQQMDWKTRQELSPYDVNSSHGTAGAVAARLLRFGLNELILIMLKRMQLEGQIWDQPWCQSTLLMHVLQYLTTRDCLLDIEPREYHDMAVRVRMHYAGILRPIAEVIRNPDFLCFEQLDPLPREGQLFRVIPRYRHGAFDGQEDVRATIEYSIEPAMPWLTWKPELGGFVGTVPLFSEMMLRTVPGTSSVLHMGSVGNYTDVHCLRFEVKAILTENFVTTARLERTIRTRLSIKIIPWYAHSSALAPKGLSFESMLNGRSISATLGPKAKKEAIASHIQKAPNDGAPDSPTTSGSWNEHISAPTKLEDRKVSKAQEQYSPWPVCDLSNYDVSSIFAEHKPYHKSNLMPGSPRKHVDELFKLDVPEDIDFGRGAVTEVQVYHVTGLDSAWRHRHDSFWRSGRTESQLAETPTTQHIEDISNVTIDSQNSLQPCPVQESEAHDFAKSSDDHDGCLDTQPASERSLELIPVVGTTIGRNHDRHRARGHLSTYDEEAERQESLHFPRSEIRKKDQRRWLDTSLIPTHRSRRRLCSDGIMDEADVEYDEFLVSCTEADAAQETNEQPDSGLSFESENGGADNLLRSAPGLRSAHPMEQVDDRKESTDFSSLNAEGDDTNYQSEQRQGTEQSTDATGDNLPVVLELWAHRSARRARYGKRVGHHHGIKVRVEKPRASHIPEDVNYFADFRFTFDCNAATDGQVEDVDYFSDFRSVFDHRADADHAAEVTEYFADFRHTFEDRLGAGHVDEHVDFFADFRQLFENSGRGRAAEPVHYFAQSGRVFGRVRSIHDEDGLLADYFADFWPNFEDSFRTSRVAEVANCFIQFERYLNEGRRCGRAADSVHCFAQSRWMFGRNDGEDDLALDYFADFRSILDGSTGADIDDCFAEFWSIFDNALEDVDYFSEFKSIFDGSIDLEYDDDHSLDASVASELDSPPTAPQTPKLPPRITCYFNRYSPLRRISHANIDIESDISQADHHETITLLQELPNLSPTDYRSPHSHSSSRSSSPSSSQLRRRRDSHHDHDSGYHSASDPTAATAAPQQPRHPYSPPLPPRRPATPPLDLTYLKPRSRPTRSSTSSPPGTRATSTFTSSRLVSAALEIIVENDDVDPRLRREQALLWSLLGTRDERLAREERKRVWDAMRLEARREGSEEWDGEDFEFMFGDEESAAETVVGSEAGTAVGEEEE